MDASLSEEKRQELLQVYGGQAVQFLRAAIERGSLDAERLQMDPGLAPLRTRQDFQDLGNEARKSTARKPGPDP
jgi:hypothetical protein